MKLFPCFTTRAELFVTWESVYFVLFIVLSRLAFITSENNKVLGIIDHQRTVRKRFLRGWKCSRLKMILCRTEEKWWSQERKNKYISHTLICVLIWWYTHLDSCSSKIPKSQTLKTIGWLLLDVVFKLILKIQTLYIEFVSLYLFKSNFIGIISSVRMFIKQDIYGIEFFLSKYLRSIHRMGTTLNWILSISLRFNLTDLSNILISAIAHICVLCTCTYICEGSERGMIGGKYDRNSIK